MLGASIDEFPNTVALREEFCYQETEFFSAKESHRANYNDDCIQKNIFNYSTDDILFFSDLKNGVSIKNWVISLWKSCLKNSWIVSFPQNLPSCEQYSLVATLLTQVTHNILLQSFDNLMVSNCYCNLQFFLIKLKCSCCFKKHFCPYMYSVPTMSTIIIFE